MESVHDDVAASVGDVVVFGFGSDGRGRRGGRCFCQTKNNEHPHPHAVGARARGFAARRVSLSLPGGRTRARWTAPPPPARPHNALGSETCLFARLFAVGLFQSGSKFDI